MNPEIMLKFEEARELVDRAENYAKETNFEFSSRCYLKVCNVLGDLLNTTTNQESAQQLQIKIKKYSEMANEMLAKEKEKRSQPARVSKFGFPVMPKKQESSIKAPKVQTSNQVRKIADIDKEIQSLVCLDIDVSFKEIVGMDDIKQALYEAVIFPQKRPDLFTGIRSPPRGLLLYGPPGNGKTYVVKALAKESGCIFYGLSAGSILNKFVGETEKTLRKLFESAKKTAPSIIFIDQIDSILTARAENQGDSTRRLKTEFLIQFDSLKADSRVILIGATNFPNQLDLAALRRFNKLLYIGLPDKDTRQGIIEKALKQITFQVSGSEMKKLVKELDGYTASEITDIVKDASMFPLREIKKGQIETVTKSKIRPVRYADFTKIIKNKKPLMTKQNLEKFQVHL